MLIIGCGITLTGFGQYNFYYGNIHSHTSYSDGNKDSVATGYYYPGDDYNYAKGSYHFDFLGISDHNHYSSVNNPGMHVADFYRGLYQADTANHDGSFVCMYGYEWGVIGPPGGHIVTYGVPKMIGWETGSGGWGSSSNYDTFCAKLSYANYWPIVNLYPNAFCTLAHPQSTDFSDLTGAAVYSASADSAIAGCAIRSGSATSTTTDYSDPAPTQYETYFMKALAKGYHLGPTADQDNHYTTFGRNNMIRTVVLARSLNRDSIIAAYKAMRFFASDDWNTQVTFTVNGNYMGSDFSTTANSAVYVSVTDPDLPGDPNDNVSKIEIYYGNPGSGINATILTSISNSNTLSYTHPTVATNTYYYYAKITQQDGDIMWTAPVWVYRSAIALPLDITRFEGQAIHKQVQLSWTTAQEFNNDYFEIERSADGMNYTPIGRVASLFHTSSTPTGYQFTDSLPFNGINFYRLKEVNISGSFAYSDVVPVKVNKPLLDFVNINPNPVSNTLTISCFANAATQASWSFYNSDGRLVMSGAAQLTAGYNSISANVSNLPAGLYFMVISRPNERLAEARFVKQ